MNDLKEADYRHKASKMTSNGVSAKQCAFRRSSPKLSHYLTALRPWSFTASFCPAVLGTILAFYSESMNEGPHTVASWSVRFLLFTCSAFTALSAHAAGNLVNTYFDYKKGVDRQTSSDDRTLVDYVLTPSHIETMAAVCYGLSLLSFFSTVYLTPNQYNLAPLALIFFLGMSGSFLYTGGPGLKYFACGEIVIFFTFGPLTVLYAYLALGESFSLWPIYYALPLSLNTLAILHSNNVRDMVSDKEAGITTIAILLGPQMSWLLFCLLVLSPYAFFIVFSLHTSPAFLLPCITLWQTFRLERKYRGTSDKVKLPQMIAMLNLSTGFVYMCSFGVAFYFNVQLLS